jgi:ammonium transporter family
LLIQLYGVAVTLMWSGGVTFVLLKLVSAFVPLRVTREHELEARLGFGEFLIQIPFSCPPVGQNYVQTLSCL